ncbi:MAG: acetate/propionate family kinase [Thermoguttaceae bacterium]
MNVLVFNCGSSSLKYRLIAMPGEKQLSGGEAQRIGPPTAKPSCLALQGSGAHHETRVIPMRNHAEALQQVVAVLRQSEGAMPDVIGHRLVNGGPNVADDAWIDDAVLAELIACQDLAPIHNPPAIATIQACREMFPGLRQVVISDTAYHRTIPEHARTYAIPEAVSRRMGIRKYGYHGISHQYVVTETARLMDVPLDRFCAVSCHLGSGGASLCAVVDGRSVDNTMGYSPLQGLIMSTRSGDLDPGVTLRLLADAVGDRTAVEARLNHRSGVLGLSGRSADIRDAIDAPADGPIGDRDRLTAEVYLWRLKKYLGAYLALVGRAHAVIFTDTIGETVPRVRESVCSGMEPFGIAIDPALNASAHALPADVAASESPVRVWAVRTNEEISIARSVYQVACKS